MRCLETSIPGVLIVETDRFVDHRGYFLETWNAGRYREYGLPGRFIQDNLSFSVAGILRGLHFQHPHAQGKLVSVLQGEVYDVAVDIRLGSPTFGQWVAVILSGDNGRQLYIPEGFAHGFCVTGASALVSYKCTRGYAPYADGGITWDDPDLGIDWPVGKPILSSKDRSLPRLKDLPADRRPLFVGPPAPQSAAAPVKRKEASGLGPKLQEGKTHADTDHRRRRTTWPGADEQSPGDRLSGY